jgi:hypothetical protein
MKTQLQILFLCLFLLPIRSIGQRNVKDSIIGTPLIGVHYGAIWTAGDLADRYGFMNHVGINGGYKTKHNWYFGLDGNFMFGNRIKAEEPTDEFYGIFDHLTDSYGNITDVNGDTAIVILYSRGFNANVVFGKLIPVLSPNKNSGIMIQLGFGYLMHRLRIETQEQVVPQLELDYKKGYDRLTSGWNSHQFVGYSYMGNSGFYNFYAGFYIQEGFTQNNRTIFFDQPDVPVSTKTRLDIQYGFRLGWYVPVYKRKPRDYYFD